MVVWTLPAIKATLCVAHGALKSFDVVVVISKCCVCSGDILNLIAEIASVAKIAPFKPSNCLGSGLLIIVLVARANDDVITTDDVLRDSFAPAFMKPANNNNKCMKFIAKKHSFCNDD